MSNTNIYRFTKEDLRKVFEFTRDYHLEETKPSSGRTNQGSRSFGGELDAFIPGKLIELGVCKILESHSTENKKLFPDYTIYSNSEVADQVDPDIVKVEIAGQERLPNIHIEIKRLSDGDEWLGMRADQLSRVEIVKGKATVENMYMIHASIFFHDEKNKKQKDIVGAVLKELIPEDKIDLTKFSSFNDLYCEIHFVYSIKDLKSKGYLYPKGEIIPTGSFSIGASAYKKDFVIRKGYSIIKKYGNGSHELTMKIERSNVVPNYGYWTLKGEFDLISTSHNKEVIYCRSNVEMFNQQFGKYFLESGNTYNFHFKNKLGSDFKNIDDHWFFKKRLSELIASNEISSNQNSIAKIIQAI